jgi:diguanylate cyclase (GGDEF)-like protein
MSAAGFVLAINLVVAGLFATAFGIVAIYYRAAIGARWLALAFLMGVVNVGLEFALPFQTDARPVSLAIFSAFLVALAFFNAGIALHYGREIPKVALGFFVLVAIAINVVILDLPRDSLLRALLYQLPYSALQLYGAYLVLAQKTRRALDIALAGLLTLNALNFISKPFLAAIIGSGGSPQGYFGSSYAAISQSSGAVLLVASGMVILLITIRDLTARSETDALTGLLNRRGFENQAERSRTMATRTDAPAVMIMVDLDHLRTINDLHGEAAGDQVIFGLARALEESFDFRAIIGRFSGGQFAILLPGLNLAEARGAVEAARRHWSEISAEERQVDASVTSSFGMAMLEPCENLADALRRAEDALHEAKTLGRDRVCIAPSPIRLAQKRPAREARA